METNIRPEDEDKTLYSGLDQLYNSKQHGVNLTKCRILLAILCALSINYSYGYTIGTNNAAAASILQFANQTYYKTYDYYMPTSQRRLHFITTSTAFPIGGVIGSLAVRFTLSFVSSLRSLVTCQIANVVISTIISALIFFNVSNAILLDRFLSGILTGFGLGVGPIFVSSLSTNRIRGFVGSMFTVAISVGAIFGNVLGLKQVLGGSQELFLLLATPAIPSFLFLIFTFFIATNRKYSKCLNPRVKKIASNEGLIEEQPITKFASLWQVLVSKRLRLQLFSGCVVMSSSQLSGINGVQNNLNIAFSAAGIPDSLTCYASIIIAVVQFISSFCGCFIALRFGRRSLLLYGNLFVIISHTLYTISCIFQDTNTWMPYISIASMIGFVSSVNMGSGLVCYTIIPELFPYKARPAAVAICVFCFWGSFTLVSFLTPIFYETLGVWAMLPYLAVASLTLLFIYFVVPETKFLSEEEIQLIFNKRC